MRAMRSGAGEPSVGGKPSVRRRIAVIRRGGILLSPFELEEEAAGKLVATSWAPAATTAAELRTLVLASVRKHARSDSIEIEWSTPLLNAGLTSLTAVDLAKNLGQQTGLSLPSTLAFECTTAESIFRRLHASLCEDDNVLSAHRGAAIRGMVASASIAICGIARSLPGGCATSRRLATMLNAAGDAIVSAPSSRGMQLPGGGEADGTSAGAFVADAAHFDPARFGLLPAEVSLTDPQQRLLLEAGYAAIHRACMRRESLLNRDLGVFVGLSACAPGIERCLPATRLLPRCCITRAPCMRGFDLAL